MAKTVERPIVSRPVSADYEAGWVFAFRKCPECKWALTVSKETPTSFHFSCTGCSVEGDVNIQGGVK